MSPPDLRLLDIVVPGLSATPPSRLPYQADVLVRSYLLERPAGNVIIYNSPGITSSAPAIKERGEVTRLLINHGHEAMYGMPDLAVPVHVHIRDRSELSRSLVVTSTFDRRKMIDDDIEVIPTAGHTAGTTSYLWDNGQHRFLFTGDFIWLEHDQWKAVVLDERLRRDYLESLALVRELEFDILVPWGATQDRPGIAHTDRARTRKRIDSIIDRVETGANR